jgi:hypothetical protein
LARQWRSGSGGKEGRRMTACRPAGLPVWLDPVGKPVSCLEEIKVLNEYLEEIRTLAQNALGVAVITGCDPDLFRSVPGELVASLE